MTQQPAPRRAVVLGASNVFRNISTVVAAARSAWGAPLELLIAAGHGRSYGMWNHVLGYSVPGILQCALWEALAARDQVPTAALITDVGNDLLYGASPETILDWVETCLARLRPVCERIAITELPLHSVARLTPRQFLFFRRLLFPASRLSLADAIAHAHRLNAGLLSLAEKYALDVVAPEKNWYGFDPIHIARPHVASAWHALLTPWRAEASNTYARGTLWQWCQLRSRRTHVQQFLARKYQTPQPSLRLADGSSVSLY